MTRLMRTEWIKLATTRGPWAVLAGLLALTALITPFAMGEIGQGDATATADAREALAIGPGFMTALVLLLLGAVAAAGEFQHRTIVSTYLITPRRGRVLAAKIFAHATLGAIVAGVGVAISFPIVLMMASRDDVHVADASHLVALALAIIGIGALASACGIAIGSILRHQTAAIIVILLWTLLLEKLFGGFFPPILPFSAILAGVGMGGDEGPSILAALSVVSAWAAALVLVARYRFIRLDVT